MSTDMEQETVEATPFLESNSGSVRTQRTRPTSLRFSNISIMILGIFLVVSNVVWFIKYSTLADNVCIRPKLSYSPATSSISYERRVLWRSIGPENVYTGKPRKELDEAWAELIKPMAIKISSSELALLGESSIAFEDGSGYLAEMAVFHELHCIKRLRRHLHLNYYYGNMTADEADLESKHIDHCLEYWREAAICRGDPSLATFVWQEGKPFSKVHSTHECVDWIKLRQWAESRMVEASDPSIFSHARSK
ncbi:uncharacterized protein F4822DRAFT_406959 [Hypoxylon trugodes]|uniref:uncharacterized protein n=1 Tax=Hypoxylon trugodes TaxID=326681 RepID=UPI00219C590B|nr:uncharacterized protein F4822DRAFT_406959 [Hypoxylon trugodes]KAI1387571.1 hypothetical protein F4822DRAFT_406959 [Hypoxylon trugodes]